MVREWGSFQEDSRLVGQENDRVQETTLWNVPAAQNEGNSC
jgi:hypothetical protein